MDVLIEIEAADAGAWCEGFDRELRPMLAEHCSGFEVYRSGARRAAVLLRSAEVMRVVEHAVGAEHAAFKARYGETARRTSTLSRVSVTLPNGRGGHDTFHV